MNDSHAPVSVAILAFPETTASVMYGMYDLFMAAGRDWGFVVDGQPGPALMRPRDRLGAGRRVRGSQRRADRTAGHARRMRRRRTSSAFRNWRFRRASRWRGGSPTRSRGCSAAMRQGATLATACSGAVLLAEAGLLDGQEATTHWAYCDILRSRYPAVKVRKERALVVSGEGQRLVMAGGGTSWQDLALYLIARFVGVDAAMQVARINLIDWHAIGQQPFARLARSRQVDDAVIARCQTWIAEHYHEPSPVTAMVRLSGLAERSFKRRFQQATGMAPLEYVHTLRLEEAKQMLETGDAADRGDRQRGRLRRRGILQPAVPAQREPHAGAVPQALRVDAARTADRGVKRATRTR